jgi:hypothetical protein
MCDPLTIGVVSAVGSIASAGIDYMGQQATLDAQNKANADWVAYQKAQSAKAQAEDEKLREQAQAAQQSTLNKVSPQSQEQTQQTQAGNLYSQFTQGTPLASNAQNDPNRTLLSGQTGAGTGASSDMTTAMAARVTNAAREAQGRIKALADLSSYGSGYGGMTQQANQAITSGNQAIALTADERGGIAKTLGVAQQVQPVQYVQGASLAGSIAGSLANLAGSAFGSAMKTKTKTA